MVPAKKILRFCPCLVHGTAMFASHQAYVLESAQAKSAWSSQRASSTSQPLATEPPVRYPDAGIPGCKTTLLETQKQLGNNKSVLKSMMKSY